MNLDSIQDISAAHTDRQRRIGFLNLYVGGTGAAGCAEFASTLRRNGAPFPFTNVLIDTDPSTFSQTRCDHAIFLEVNGDIVTTLKGNAGLFRKEVAKILIDEAHMLSSGDIQNGMRTTRALTQLVFHYHETTIQKKLQGAIDSLVEQKASHIIPVIVSSTGGGTGSAGAVLLLRAFSRRRFVSTTLMGLRASILLPSLVLALEPFAFARQKQGMQRKKILANSYAYRLETDELVRRGCPVQYFFHIGYSNEEGACLKTKDQISQVLGSSLYGLERNYSELKRDWVDGPDDLAVTIRPKLLNSLSRDFFNSNGRGHTAPPVSQPGDDK